jgi:hypothetical protein
VGGGLTGMSRYMVEWSAAYSMVVTEACEQVAEVLRSDTGEIVEGGLGGLTRRIAGCGGVAVPAI